MFATAPSKPSKTGFGHSLAAIFGTLLLAAGFVGCGNDPAGTEDCIGEAGCECAAGTCMTGLVCDVASNTCVFDPGGGTDSVGDGDGDGDGSDGGVPGNLPCDGCPGAVCDQNEDCQAGLLCNRVNDSIAWCTNCNAFGTTCNFHCEEDSDCGMSGICHIGRCWHGCESDNDCPSGHDCVEGEESDFCAPSGLPDLDDECVMSSAGWCESFIEGDGTCILTGTDPQTDPGDNWCSKSCSNDGDCTDVWPLGCCSAPGIFSGGRQMCIRPEYADQFCNNAGQCDPGCDYCWFGTSSENNCDPAWNGAGDGCDCGCQFVDSDCG